MSWFGNTETQQPAEKRKLANISDDAINSNQQAVPVKYLAGRNYVVGDYISPAYNPRAQPIKQDSGGSKFTGNKEQITGYKYFADFALMLCMGGRRPVDAVYKVIQDDDIIWSGNISRGGAAKEVININKHGIIHLYWGMETQPIDGVLLTPRSQPGGDPQDATTWSPAGGSVQRGDPHPYSGHYDEHPAYRGQCYAVFKDWKLGRDRTSVPNIAFELKRGCPWFGGAGFNSDDTGINPIPILFDWLTDTRFGMGMPESQLVQTTFTNTKTALDSLGAKLSVLITEQSEFRQVVAEFLEYFDGWIRREGNQIAVGYWTHGTPVSSATLTDNELLGEPELAPQGWGPTLNEVTVVYSDKDHHYNSYTQTHRDPNNFRITGMPKPVTLQRPWITTAALAKKYAKEYGSIRALPFTAGQLTVKREWVTSNNMLPGKVFTFNSGFYGLSFLLRLLEIEYAADNAAASTLTVEWERAKWPSLYIPPPFQGPGGFLIGPRAIYKQTIMEVPYLLQSHTFVTQVLVLAVKGEDAVTGMKVWVSFDSGATYDMLINTRNFCAYGKISVEDIAYNQTYFLADLYGIGQDEIVVEQTSQAQRDNALLALFNDATPEAMSIGSISAWGVGTFQIDVLRNRLGTKVPTGTYHYSGTDVFFQFRAHLDFLDHAQFVPGNTVYFKLQPYTELEEMDITEISPITYVIQGFEPVDAPTFDPPSGTFSTGTLLVKCIGDTGTTVRYSQSGADVTFSSAVMPAGGVTIGVTTHFKARAYLTEFRYSNQVTAHFTKVATAGETTSGGSSTSICATVGFSFSGTKGHSSGNLTLTCATSSSVIKYKKNGGTILNYSSPISLACTNTGDDVEAWGTKSGLQDSPHRVFDNTRLYEEGGGGHGGGGGGPIP